VSLNSSLPKAPKHLKPATKRWFEHVVNEYQLDSHHLRLLQLAAESWNRSQEARTLLAKEGITVKNRHDESVPHPAISIERDSAIRFSRLLRELDLDIEVTEAQRPPALRSNRPLKAIAGGNRA